MFLGFFVINHSQRCAGSFKWAIKLFLVKLRGSIFLEISLQMIWILEPNKVNMSKTTMIKSKGICICEYIIGIPARRQLAQRKNMYNKLAQHIISRGCCSKIWQRLSASPLICETQRGGTCIYILYTTEPAKQLPLSTLSLRCTLVASAIMSRALFIYIALSLAFDEAEITLI